MIHRKGRNKELRCRHCTPKNGKCCQNCSNHPPLKKVGENIAEENESHFCFTSNDISLLTESWLKHLFQIKPPSAEDSNLKLKWQHPTWHYSLPLMKGDSRRPDNRALRYHRCRKMSLSPTEKRRWSCISTRGLLRKEKVSTLIIGKPQMSLFELEGTDFNGEFSTTYQQKKTTESQTKDQWTSQVGIFKNALLGRPKRVEYRKCLKRIQKFSILKPHNLLVRWTWRTFDERENNENVSSFDTTNFSSFMCKIISENVFSLPYQIIPKKENVILAIQKQTKHL